MMTLSRSTLAVALLAANIAVSGATAQAPTFPGEHWPTARPADVGLNPVVLDSIDREIRAGQYGYVDRVLVIRHTACANSERRKGAMA